MPIRAGLGNSALQHLEAATNLGISPNRELRRVLLYHEAVLLQRSARFEHGQTLLQQLCLEGTTGAEVNDALGMTLLRMSAKAPPGVGTPDRKVVAGIGQAGCLGQPLQGYNQPCRPRCPVPQLLALAIEIIVGRVPPGEVVTLHSRSVCGSDLGRTVAKSTDCRVFAFESAAANPMAIRHYCVCTSAHR